MCEQSDPRLQLELLRCMLLPLGRRVTAAQSSRSALRVLVASIASLNSLTSTVPCVLRASSSIGEPGGVTSWAFIRGRGKVKASHTVLTANRERDPSLCKDSCEPPRRKDLPRVGGVAAGCAWGTALPTR